MATLKEWKRDFNRLPKWQKFSIVSGLIIGIIGLILTVVPMVTNHYAESKYEKPTINFNNQNMTVIGNNIQGNYNTTIITNAETESGIPNTNLYPKIYSLYNNIFKGDFFFVKVVLPDGQIAFVDKFLHNTRYDIAQCNDGLTDCYIYHKFKVNNLPEDQVCWILPDKWEYGKKFLIYPEECSSGIKVLPDGRFKSEGMEKGSYVIIGTPSIVIQEYNAAENNYTSGHYNAAFNHAQNAIKAYEDSKTEEFGVYYNNGILGPDWVSMLYITGTNTAQELGDYTLAHQYAALAYQYANRALHNYDTPFNNAEVAITLYNLGKYMDALNYSKKALQVEPNNSWFISVNNDILKAIEIEKISK
ncbi:MAG: hypothetical protein OI715_00475 (plasmid) [Candidatus Methanoperedens sp.]|nr:MAG: hypothetical protein OI715_00475 [Candidatus Methanoperedens sp.]